ncbi:hypothetical protein J7E88_05875 [Streptomyces sp. ISL-10]|uniref:hypothetical protein n=1 Tax=Streptomyces sp. ISL-10 TaxID=2819172 RepID=UPI001BEAD5A6|nr:hypothetical protein [Streptomyces sp. ISL-10]MBT2364861.1 hypothetical protein [Streptomyces sp. ISL-10]
MPARSLCEAPEELAHRGVEVRRTYQVGHVDRPVDDRERRAGQQLVRRPPIDRPPITAPSTPSRCSGAAVSCAKAENGVVPGTTSLVPWPRRSVVTARSPAAERVGLEVTHAAVERGAVDEDDGQAVRRALVVAAVDMPFS